MHFPTTVTLKPNLAFSMQRKEAVLWLETLKLQSSVCVRQLRLIYRTTLLYVCLDCPYVSFLLQAFMFLGNNVLKLTQKTDNIKTSYALGAIFSLHRLTEPTEKSSLLVVQLLSFLLPSCPIPPISQSTLRFTLGHPPQSGDSLHENNRHFKRNKF